MGKGAPAGLSKDDEIARLGEELQAHELMVNEEVKARERLERENLTKIKTSFKDAQGFGPTKKSRRFTPVALH